MYWDKFGYDVIIKIDFIFRKSWLLGLIVLVLFVMEFIVRVKFVIYLLYSFVKFFFLNMCGILFILFFIFIEKFLKCLIGFLKIIFWIIFFIDLEKSWIFFFFGVLNFWIFDGIICILILC